MNRQFGMRTLLLVGVASVALAPELARAADAADAAAATARDTVSQFEEIVVTATRRDASAERVVSSRRYLPR